MTDLQKIDELIAAQRSETNYLAMQMMLSLFNFSFEQAFLRLQLRNQENRLLQLDIADISIQYKVDLQQMIYVPSAYADIERAIFFRERLEPNSDIKLYADEDSIFGLGEFGRVEQLPQIQEDLQTICPHIEALYELMQEE